MTAKEYLSQAYRLDQRIDSNIAEITRLREMACGISSPSWEEKVQTSRNTDAPFVKMCIRDSTGASSPSSAHSSETGNQ